MSDPAAPSIDLDARIADHFPNAEPIAVVGHACRFPEAPDSEAFWHAITTGQVCSTVFSRAELVAAGWDAATIDAPEFVPVGTVIADADAFDAELFGYSRQEAELIDPQQRLFLQLAWHALEHAGYAPRNVPHRTGIFGATRVSTYPGREPMNLAEIGQVRGLQSLMGNDKDYVATRVAYKLNLRGPALTVQTACSSSLVAVHLACESLRSGECDMAVAGGIAMSFPQAGGYLHQPGMIFSPDGQCRPFDAAAQGTFPGNGGATVTLRRLADALRDGDPVIAVIAGSAINNDGAGKAGFTAPSVTGQTAVLQEAMMLAGIDVDAVGMIEAHGTATPLGDPIEMQALRRALGGSDAPCAIGSVKGNIGHLDTAAGIASLLKAILSVERGVIPPLANFAAPNPALQIAGSRFHMPIEAETWDTPKRVAGVSSFGIGGTNCHMIVAALPEDLRCEAVRPDIQTPPALLLSAATPEALRDLAGLYATLAERALPHDVAYSARIGRQRDLPCRLAATLDGGASAALAAFAHGETDPLVRHGHGDPGKTVWLFSGQGCQWAGMGSDMAAQSPAFAAMLDRCADACDRLLDAPLREVMYGSRTDLLARMDHAQPAIVAFEVAAAAHWHALGLKPDMVLGHSVGEYAAVVVAGACDIEDVLPLVHRRGQLMQQCPAGAMLAVFTDETTLIGLIDGHPVEIAAFNGPRHFVVSGTEDAIARIVRRLDDVGIRHNRLAVTGAAHSALLDPILNLFQQAASKLAVRPLAVPLISGVSGRFADPSTLAARDYWVRHLRAPVRYADAMATAQGSGARLFLELGPDAPLTGMGQRDAPVDTHWIATARRHQPAAETLHQAALAFYVAGAALPFDTLLPVGGQKVRLPLYPFARTRFWRVAGPHTTPANAIVDPAIKEGRRVAVAGLAGLDLKRLERLYACVTDLHAVYVDRLVRQCVGDAFEEGVDALDILRRGRLLPRHRQLLRRLLDNGVEDGFLSVSEGRYTPARAIPHHRLDTLLAELRDCCEGLDAIPDTVARAGDALYAMMAGKVEPVAIIFPDGDSSGVETLYQDFSFGRYFNDIAGGVVAGMIRARPDSRQPFRVLEVGGGTGGTTATLLPVLAGQRNVRYDFTDISPLFTRRAEDKFAHFDFLDYRPLDLDEPIAAQGFAPASYDLIVAANVIHATPDIGRTLGHLRPLLKPGGRLLMREITRPMRLFDFVFGPLMPPILDEQARGGGLFPSPATWERCCIDAGFARLDRLPDDDSVAAGISEHILLATVPGAEVVDLRDIAEPSDPVLGDMIAPEGVYLADWSDCGDDPGRWRERYREAYAMLAERHGAGRKGVFDGDIPSRPAMLDRMRLRWTAEAFGGGRMRVEIADDIGGWCAIDAPVQTRPAPDTHYRWNWHELPAPLPARPLSTKARIVRLESCRSIAAIADTLLAALNDGGDGPLLAVTQQAWRVGEDGSANPVQRAAWGLLKVAAVERPDRLIAAIDVPEGAEPVQLDEALPTLSQDNRWIAMRGGRLLSPRLHVPMHHAAPVPDDLLTGPGWHVVTGAFGALGRLSVAWIAARGGRRIALLAPRAPADWIAWEQEMVAQHRCTLRWIPCDVSDAAMLDAVLNDLASQGGIAGIVHAAGVIDDAPLMSIDPVRLAPVLAVKADAASRMHEWLTRHDGRYLLLYSSAAASLGAAGQAAHAMASAYLDGLAEAQAGRSGPATIAIGWGAWGEAGRGGLSDLRERLAASGMDVLSNAEGLWHLEQAIMRGAPCHLAMRLLPDRLDPVRRLLVAELPTRPQPPVGLLDVPIPALDNAAAVQDWLTRRIGAQLRITDLSRIAPTRDLLQLGLDSLLFLELRNAIERSLGVRIDAERAYRDLSVTGLSGLILEQAATAARPIATTLRHDPDRRFDPFPLTPIQHAYWLGRTDLIEYGGVACQILFEWDKGHDTFDLDRFEAAWNAVVQRHDMLRMVVDPDGRQRVLRDVPYYRIERHDLSGLAPQDREQALADTRATLAARVLPADRWPLFGILASDTGGGCYRLYLQLDLLAFDVQSLKVMMDDLARAYRGEALPVMTITFRDHVMADEARREAPAWQQSLRYWQERLDDLPAAPILPLPSSIPIGPPRFTTRTARLPRNEWQALKHLWKVWGVTPSAALLALFARVIERWARSPDFTLNLTYFSRRSDHPQMAEIIGDFTSVLLVDFDLRTPRPLREDIERTQRRLWDHLAHAQVNGVELIRDMARMRGSGGGPAMPIVFTSMIGMALDGQGIDQAMTGFLGDPTHVLTQTPQVWLDHQVMEMDGDLVVSWYCMDEALDDGVAAGMFADFQDLLMSLAGDPARFDATGVGIRDHCGAWHPIGRRSWPLSEIPSLDGRAIEIALESQPAVTRALARSDRQGGLDIVVVPVSDDGTPAISSGEWIDHSALPTLSRSDVTAMDDAWAWLEDRALVGMAATLARNGLFRGIGEHHSAREVIDTLRVQPRHHRLIRQWLAKLCAAGVLERDADRFVARASLDGITGPAGTQPMEGWASAIAGYLEKCIERHDQLLDGREAALSILFGDESVTRALYADNPVAACLNDSAAAVARMLLGQMDGPLSVLEIGAGTGSTTRRVRPALGDDVAIYRFTDLSPAFLSDARSRYAGDKAMDYGIFNVDTPDADDIRHPEAGYGMIVAANVLHDAVNLPRSLRGLAHLLGPEGRLMLIEATAPDSALQLASIGFVEGLNGFRDFRAADGRPMLDLDGWRRVLEEAGYAIELVWPHDQGDSYRQHLIVARPVAITRLDVGALEAALSRDLGLTLPPVRIRQADQLPDLRLNGAVRKTPPAPAVPQPMVDPVERQVAALWQTMLDQSIDRGSDFFQSGGDSLIATRMVAQLNRAGIRGATLQALFANPVLSDFCTILSPAVAASWESVTIAQGRKRDRVVLVHASDGGLGGYISLANRLDCLVQGLEVPDLAGIPDLSALARGHAAAIEANGAIDTPFLLAGWSYGSLVAAEIAHILAKRNRPVRLVLIDPVAPQDFACRDVASMFRMLARGHDALTLPDDLEEREASAQRACFLAGARAAGLFPPTVDDHEAERRLARMAELFRLLDGYEIPSPPPVPCLWIEAARRPAQWQPAETAWSKWLATAERHVMDADHWQLVMDEDGASRTAFLILEWLRHLDVTEVAA